MTGGESIDDEAGGEDTPEDIHIASDDSPILTTYEPDFQRVFARGTLLQNEGQDNSVLQMAFWSSKDEGIEVDKEGVDNAVGYRLETEVMMHWDGIIRLRDLLDNYIEDHAPERYQAESE